MKHSIFLLACFFTLASTHLLAQSNAPANLKAISTAYNQVVLAWEDKSTNETRFEIERKDFASFTKIGEVNANIVTYTDKTVTASNTYIYRIKAVFVTNTNYSNELTVNTPQEPPGTPTGFSVMLQGSSVLVKWDNGSGGTPTSYRVERSVQGGAYSLYQTVAYSRTPSLTDNGVQPGQQYCYRVQATNGGGSSGFAGPGCQTIPLAPTSVSNLKATKINSSSIKVTWDPFGKENPIEIQRRLGTTGAWGKVASTQSNAGEYIDNGLAASTQYCYRIAEDGHDFSAIECATTDAPPAVVPVTPSGLMVSVISDTQLQVFWTDINTVPVTFEISRADKPGGNYTVIQPTYGSKIYDDKGLTASTQYCYKVRAKNSAGLYSGFTAEVCNTTKAPPVIGPEPPTTLQAMVQSSMEIKLDWTATTSTFGTGYRLEVASSPGGTYSTVADIASNQTTYNHTGLSPNTQYCYRVRTKYNTTLSNPSNEVCVSTPPLPVTIPRPPSNLTAIVVSFGQVDLTWSDNSTDESGFELDRSTDGVTFQKIQEPGANAISYSDKTVQPRTTYYYRIRAKNSAGPSANSNTVQVTTPDSPPAAPARLMAVATSSTQINLTWEDVSDNETEFQLEQSTDGGATWKKLPAIPANQKAYSDVGLTPSTHYYYRLRAANAVGQSGYVTADATTLDKPLPPPAAPVSLSAVATSATQISLTWVDKADNESGFVIERSPDGSTNWTKAGDAAMNAVSFVDNGLTPNTTYFYRVRATNAAGPSDNSNTASATTPDVPPAAPARLVVTVTSATSATLSWADLSTNETGFEIERGSSATGTFTKVGDAPMNATTFEDRGLVPATPYCYRVRAKNTIGNSNFSDIICVATPDVPPTAPARLVVTSASPEQLNLVWADLSTNESGFEIERGTSSTGTFSKIAEVGPNVATYEDKNLTDNTAYCYRVRAKNAAGPSAYTDPVCATTPLAPPATPLNLAAQVFDYDQIKLAWDALPAKATTVIIERATNPNGPFTEIKQQPAAQNSYVDVGLQEFTTYYYRIKAINTAGPSGNSNVASARIEEVIIAVEDELDTHTTLLVSERRLHVITNWFSTMQAAIHLHTATGQPVLTDNRKVRPADRWEYNLDALPSGLYIINIIADGRKLAKRILLP